jgi:hydrogenase maturation protease
MRPGKSSVRVIGMGNTYRGDDAIGLHVARAVGKRLPDVDIVAGVADGTALLELWSGVELCLLVDCAVSGSTPGTVHSFDGLAQEIPAGLFSSFSTHAFSIPQSIELGRALDRLPDRLLVYAVEGSNFTCGTALTDQVQEAADKLTARIIDEIESYRHRSGHAIDQ